MKLNDLEYCSNELLETIIATSPFPEIIALAKQIQDIRKNDLDVEVFEQGSPVWDTDHNWSYPSSITEGSLYDHVKRKTGLVSGDWYARVIIYTNRTVYEPVMEDNDD